MNEERTGKRSNLEAEIDVLAAQIEENDIKTDNAKQQTEIEKLKKKELQQSREPEEKHQTESHNLRQKIKTLEKENAKLKQENRSLKTKANEANQATEDAMNQKTMTEQCAQEKRDELVKLQGKLERLEAQTAHQGWGQIRRVKSLYSVEIHTDETGENTRKYTITGLAEDTTKVLKIMKCIETVSVGGCSARLAILEQPTRAQYTNAPQHRKVIKIPTRCWYYAKGECCWGSSFISKDQLMHLMTQKAQPPQQKARRKNLPQSGR